MRRPIGFRKAPPASAGWSMIEHISDVNFNTPPSPTRMRTRKAATASTMTTTSPTSPTSTSSSRISLSKRDTGFPPGFCGNRNTSLPHPNANLSPDACITEDDIAITRALARHRMSFIAQKEKQHRMLNRGMALNSIEETEHQHHQYQHPDQSTASQGGFLAGGRDPSFSTVGRLALSSLHGAEFRRHLRRPGSNGTNASDDSAVSNTTANTITSSVFSEEPARLSGSPASSVVSSSGCRTSTAPSSPTPYAYAAREEEANMTKRLSMDKKNHTKGAVDEQIFKDPRDGKRDPRDGRITMPPPPRPDGGASEKSSIKGKGLKKRSSLMWFHRLIHR